MTIKKIDPGLEMDGRSDPERVVAHWKSLGVAELPRGFAALLEED